MSDSFPQAHKPRPETTFHQVTSYTKGTKLIQNESSLTDVRLADRDVDNKVGVVLLRSVMLTTCAFGKLLFIKQTICFLLQLRTLCIFSAIYSNSPGTVTWVPAHQMGADFG